MLQLAFEVLYEGQANLQNFISIFSIFDDTSVVAYRLVPTVSSAYIGFRLYHRRMLYLPVLLARQTDLVLILMTVVEKPSHDVKQISFVVKNPPPVNITKVKVKEAFRLA